MQPTVIVLIVIIVLLVIALAAVGATLSRRRRSERLQEHYGPEYERTLDRTGDRRATEAELAEREKRHSKLDVRDLEPEERDRFAASWTEIQRGFVDDPVRAVHDADRLVADIMHTRGYPDDVERRADDISVEHPQVVQRYREARAVREAVEQGRADTEQQRHAVTSYRDLVDALLGHGATRRATDPRSTGAGSAEVHSADTHSADPHRADAHSADPHRADPHRAEPHRAEPHRAEPHANGRHTLGHTSSEEHTR